MPENPNEQPRCLGAPLARLDGPRLAQGRGSYLADRPYPGLVHLAIGRSPLAHARIVSIDASRAQQMPGVLAVLTQADLEAAGARPMTHMLPPPAKPLTWGLLASERVRFAGEAVFAVVAQSRALAEDACEAVEVDYDELACVVDPESALASSAPLLYPQWASNELLSLSSATPGFAEAMSSAPRRLAMHLESHRVCGLPLEPRGAQARWDPGRNRLEVEASNQQPHQLRTVIAETCGLEESQVRVLAPDMGGGFGNKQHFSKEECLVAMTALITGRPVRWLEDRTEALVASIHSRPQRVAVEVGYDDSGRVLALEAAIVADLGVPELYFSGVGPPLVTATCLTGGYDIAHVSWRLRCVATNTCPVGAYRGFGQPEAHFVTERIMDRVAAELALDPAELRRLNLIPDRPRPWMGHNHQRMDCGRLGELLDELVDRFDYAGWKDRRAEAKDRGRFVGVGLATLVQGTTPTQHDTAGRFASLEMASVRILPDGAVGVRVGTKSQGQGHETALAQVVAEELGVEVSSVVVADGDTDALVYGQGTWGSRSAVMGGGAVKKAARRLRHKLALVGAGLDVEVPTTGPLDRKVIERLAQACWWHPHLLPEGVEPGLTETVVYHPGRTGPQPGGGVNHDETYGAHAAAVAVEVDAGTGHTKVLAATMVSDCGVVINPAIAAGQNQGGFVQGLGAVLLERIDYDQNGQPLCSTLADYKIPTVAEALELEVFFRPTPSELEGGFRGLGEASIIVAPAALAGAIEDALSPLGVTVTSTRLDATRLRQLLRRAGYAPKPEVWATEEDLPSM